MVSRTRQPIRRTTLLLLPEELAESVVARFATDREHTPEQVAVLRDSLRRIASMGDTTDRSIMGLTLNGLTKAQTGDELGLSQEVGAWVHRVREGWHLGRAKADRARVLAERLHEIGGDVTVQEPFGSPPGQSGPPGKR